MKTVHKFKVLPGVYTWMPEDAELLSVGEQRGGIVCWAIVDTEKPEKARMIAGSGTGHPLPDGEVGKFIGTVQMHDGLVFHFFDCGFCDPTSNKPTGEPK